MKINQPGVEVETSDYIIEGQEVSSEANFSDASFFKRGVRSLKRKFQIHNKQPEPLVKSIINPFQGLMFDIFHPTYYDPYFLELIEKPYVLTVYDMIHEIYSEYFSPSDTVIKNKRILCEKADKIIAISQSTKNDLIDIFKLPEDKIYAIPLASNFNDVIPQKPSGTEALSDYILFVGLRSAYKNFYFSVIALSEILKNDKKLSLVCTGHEFSNEEINFFKNLKIENQVKHIYLQNDNELAWVYQHARLFIFPSLYEGFGLPLLEAFAKNCPVICSTSGSLPEVGGDAVIYFQPKNINEIQEAAHKAIYDNEVREELISKGQKQLSKFSWDKCRSQTIDVYNTVYIN